MGRGRLTPAPAPISGLPYPLAIAMDPAPLPPWETATFPPVAGNACIVPVWGRLCLSRLLSLLDICGSILRCKTHKVHSGIEPFLPMSPARAVDLAMLPVSSSDTPRTQTPQSGSASQPKGGLMALHHCQETPLNPVVAVCHSSVVNCDTDLQSCSRLTQSAGRLIRAGSCDWTRPTP